MLRLDALSLSSRLTHRQLNTLHYFGIVLLGLAKVLSWPPRPGLGPAEVPSWLSLRLFFSHKLTQENIAARIQTG